MNVKIHLPQLVASSLLLTVCALVWAEPVPIIVPGTPMPDGNGQVKSVTAHAQLPDGRLIVGIDITRAWSPTTGLPLMTNYGVYNYNIQTGQMVREFRHDYPEDQGGTPVSVGTREEDLMHVPMILGNGDRIYPGKSSAHDCPVYRYIDGQGLIFHGSHVYYWLRSMYPGINGHLCSNPSTLTYYALSRDGTDTLLSHEDLLPGTSSLVKYIYGAACGQDGWHTLCIECFGVTKELIQMKSAEIPYMIRHPSSGSSVFGYGVKPNGRRGLAFLGSDVLIQNAPCQPLSVALAYEQSFRGDHRISKGRPGTCISQGFLEGGFVTDLLVYDSRTDTELGRAVCLFEADGTLAKAVLPGDSNPFGSSTVKEARIKQVSYRENKYLYRNESAVTVLVNLDETDTFGNPKRAWWRLNRDGGLEQELVIGQIIPGTTETILGALLLETTFDGRSVYRISYRKSDSEDQYKGYACYTPGQGLRFDVAGGRYSDYCPYTGIKGSRLYEIDDSIWFVTDGEEAKQLVPESVEVCGRQHNVEGGRAYGMTPAESVVLRLDVQNPDTFDSFTVFYLYDGEDMIELLDLSQPFDGKQISSSLPQYSNGWVFVAPGDLPVFQITFEDGTSGLYAVPEPGTVSLLAMGALTLLIRKRSSSKA